MGWTSLAFFAVTAAAIWWHLRASWRRGSEGSAPACPRCGAAMMAGAIRCTRCGVPMQVFELVRAPAAGDDTPESAGLPRAMVRADMCVGCGTCVAVCPEPGAITLRGKLAVVDNARCQGHGECVAACPIGAIAVTRGAAINRVAVPLVDANFETNVPGLHIVGELGGRGLIKNAINEGRMAIDYIASVLPPGEARRGQVDQSVDVAIVGSGPAGLSAGIEAVRVGLSYVLLEQGSLSESVRKYPRHKLLMAEPVQMPLYGNLWVADTSKEALLRAWEGIVASCGLQVRTGERVEQVAIEGDAFRIDTPVASYRARRVVLAMGRRGSPRKLGVPGEDLAKVFYDIVEMEQFADRRVLVVGGGDSAIESAVGLANQRGAEVTLSYRGAVFARIKPRNREKLDRAAAAGRLTILLNSELREIRDDVVVLAGPDGTRIVPNDDVVIRIGGDPPQAFLERIGVRIVQKDLAMPGDQAKVS